MKARKKKSIPSTSNILYKLGGFEPIDNVIDCDDHCWLCGMKISRGVPWNKWQGANFTDQNKCSCPKSDHVCSACVWVCSWVQPPGHEKAPSGKKGVNLRLFTHLYDFRGYHYYNKKDKLAIKNWLRGEHVGYWFAAITDTGQKHTVPWTPVNPAGMLAGKGVVYFEERAIMLGDWDLVDDVVDQLNRGITKTEILDGNYRPKSWIEYKNEINEFELKHGKFRGGGWFTLSLWLSQRSEDGR